MARSLRYEFDSQEEYESHLSSLSDLELEEEADRILADQRRETVSRHTDMRDYLSVGQLKTRYSREIYNLYGSPDEALFSGLVKRAYSPPRDRGPLDLRDKE